MNHSSKPTLMVLGADGFIGRNVLEYFHGLGTYNLIGFYHEDNEYPLLEGVTQRRGDLKEESTSTNLFEGVDIVIQAAATTTGSQDVINAPFLHVTDNAVMNSYIFRECHLAGVKHVIFPSCTVMYQPKETAQSEEDWNASDEIYGNYFGVGNTKVYLERMCEFYSRLGNTKFTAIRHSNVFGPYDKFDLAKCHVLPAFVNKIVAATDELEIWGSGKAKRDLLYIDDLVRFIDLAIQNQQDSYELFNCGVGEAVSILDLASTICSLEGKTLEFKLNIDKPDIPTTVVLNCDKAKKLLGWEPKVSLEEGLINTLAWYKNEYSRSS